MCVCYSASAMPANDNGYSYVRLLFSFLGGSAVLCLAYTEDNMLYFGTRWLWQTLLAAVGLVSAGA